MADSMWFLMNVVGPVLLIGVLIWLVIRTRSKPGSPSDRRAEEGTRELYAEEEQRRRDGTDDL